MTDDGSKAPLLSARFNQLSSCVAVATGRGYRIYTCDPFVKCYESTEGGMGIVEMLFNTSLITLVGAGQQAAFSPRRVRLFNTRTKKYLCELNFVGTVLNVKLNKSRLAAVLESKIHVFDLKTMKILHALDTPKNPTGIVAMSPSVQNCYLAFPASADKGEIFIYDALNLQLVTKLKAHNGPVRVIAFNNDGTRLATVSEKGTVIRVFSVPDGQKLHTFRRGISAALVNSISFNETSTLIALSSSDSVTVHVFSLATTGSGLGAYLPGVLQDFVDPSRDFATIHLKAGVFPSAVGFSGKSALMVLTATGHFFRYSVPEKGGVCKLEAENSLMDKPSEVVGAKMHAGEGKAGGEAKAAGGTAAATAAAGESKASSASGSKPAASSSPAAGAAGSAAAAAAADADDASLEEFALEDGEDAKGAERKRSRGGSMDETRIVDVPEDAPAAAAGERKRDGKSGQRNTGEDAAAEATSGGSSSGSIKSAAAAATAASSSVDVGRNPSPAKRGKKG